jgi:hypothetical protein
MTYTIKGLSYWFIYLCDTEPHVILKYTILQLRTEQSVGQSKN